MQAPGVVCIVVGVVVADKAVVAIGGVVVRLVLLPFQKLLFI